PLPPGEEMTASPLLPPGVAGHMTETEATDAELGRPGQPVAGADLPRPGSWTATPRNARVLVHADAIPARPPRRSGRWHRLLIRIDPGTTGRLARGLPGLVAIGAADAAGTVADVNGGHLVGEEDPVR